jgi:Tetratricopeptide repeat
VSTNVRQQKNARVQYDSRQLPTLAEPWYQAGRHTLQERLGGAHPQVAVFLNSLGTFYIDQARFREAEPLLQQALAIFQQALGAEHPFTQRTQDNLAGLKFEESLPRWLRTPWIIISTIFNL